MTKPAPDPRRRASGGISRREFLRHGSIYGGGLVLALQLPRPRAARAAAASTLPAVFDAAQWKTIEAITGRIIPTDHEPGAIEAGCVNFIDKALAHEDAEAKPLYVLGVAGTDAVAVASYGKAFAALAPEQQDAVLADLQSGDAPGWPEGPVPAPLFFETVRAHTVIGFLADPRYGGNRAYAGWKVVGYPGPRHHSGGYTPEQMLGQAKIRAIWGEEI
jgi:gluconate 2-dehydrogenase gamma chain